LFGFKGGVGVSQGVVDIRRKKLCNAFVIFMDKEVGNRTMTMYEHICLSRNFSGFHSTK
jgi:hypothetical protein